jgi:hypothetical protein
MELRIRTPLSPCVSDTSHLLSHNLQDDPITKEVLCVPVVFLILVHAWSYLVAMVLSKALFPCISERIQVQNKFPVQECWLLDALGLLQ